MVAWVLAGAGVVVTALAPSPRSAVAAGAFSASSEASGVSVTMRLSGVPLTDTPVDAAGPVAQVAADSLGTSTAFAAFPDPGPFVLGIPALAGAALANTPLPRVPDYPFYVRTDANTTQERSAGEGPYRLSASSTPESSKAAATGGLQTDAATAAALVTSTANVVASAGRVRTTAVAEARGFTAGPLSIGHVRSTAEMTLDDAGTVQASTALEVTGMRVGDVAVSLGPDGFRVADQAVALPIGTTLDSLLAPHGITVEVLGEQRHPDRVVAPALRVVVPFRTPVAEGTATVTIGAASASLAGVAPGGPAPSDRTTPDDDTTIDEVVVEPVQDVVVDGPAPAAAVDVGLDRSLGATGDDAARRAGHVSEDRPSLRRVARVEHLDIRSVYLALVLAGALVAGAGGFFRRLGWHA